MNRRSMPKPRRTGFTLIELLVVIAILAILMGLTSASIFKILKERYVLEARNEISQMATGMAAFQQKFGSLPPSKVFLARNRAAYDPKNLLHRESMAILDKISRGWDNVDWSGGRGLSAGGVILEGPEALVFFLGGIPSSTGANVCLGFSTVPGKPDTPGGNRLGPYYEFPSNRLAVRPNNGGHNFFCFADPWCEFAPWSGQPYAFFSTGVSTKYNDQDCQSLGILPYIMSAAPNLRYHNAATYQIICAGENKQFGPGTLWSAADAENINPTGKDDMTNIHGKFMGIP